MLAMDTLLRVMTSKTSTALDIMIILTVLIFVVIAYSSNDPNMPKCPRMHSDWS